jgi:hypothetical protein
MPIPHPSKTPQQQLIESLNVKYQVNLSVNQVRFGTPILLDGDVETTLDPLVRNSSVEITNAVEEPYEFTTMLHFNRLSLASLFLQRSVLFAGAITHTHHLLSTLTSRLGFPVGSDDIVGHTIDTPAGYPLNVLLLAAPGSLLLYGQIEVTLTGP